MLLGLFISFLSAECISISRLNYIDSNFFFIERKNYSLFFLLYLLLHPSVSSSLSVSLCLCTYCTAERTCLRERKNLSFEKLSQRESFPLFAANFRDAKIFQMQESTNSQTTVYSLSCSC
jgi:hypothetical protein